MSLLGNFYSLQVVDNQVVTVRTKQKEGYTALQIGAVDHTKIKRV